MSTHPDEVPELEGWRFIRDHPIAKQVERYEPGRLRLARYLSDDGQHPQGQLGVIRLYYGELPGIESNEKWASWIIVVRCLNDDDTAMCGEPNGRILLLMQAFDTWARGRDPKHLQKYAARIREQREKRASEAFHTSMEERAHGFVKKWQREHSANPSIFVKKGIS